LVLSAGGKEALKLSSKRIKRKRGGGMETQSQIQKQHFITLNISAGSGV
jgi:hypothetical protein